MKVINKPMVDESLGGAELPHRKTREGGRGGWTEFGNIPQFRGKQRTKSQQRAVNKAGENSRKGGALVAKRRKCCD